MSYSLAPNIKSRFFITGTNKPLAGGLMYTYLVGTTTKAATYSDATGTPNTNPIVLDSDGECNLYLDDAISYRIILKNAAGVTQFDEDRIASINNAQAGVIIQDDGVAFKALLSQSDSTINGGGKTIVMTHGAVITGVKNLIVRDMTIDCSGVMTYDDAAHNALKFKGTQEDSINITANALIGQNTIYCNTGTLSAGDLIFVSSDKVITTLIDTKISQYIKVLAVFPTYITTDVDLLYTYNTADNAKLAKVNPTSGIRFENVKFIGSGAGLQNALLFDKASDCHVDVNVDTFDFVGVQFEQSYNCTATGTFKNAQAAGLSYGVSILHGSQHVRVSNAFGEDLRHLVTLGGSHVNNYCGAYNNHARNCRDAGIDSHPASNYYEIVGNTIECTRHSFTPKDGIISQGLNTRISNNTVIGAYSHSIVAQSYCTADFKNSVTVTGNRCFGSGNNANIHINTSAVGGFDSVVVSENETDGGQPIGIFIEAESGDIKNVKICNNHRVIANNLPIYLNAVTGFNIDNFVIKNNEIQLLDDVSATSKTGIYCIGVSKSIKKGLISNNRVLLDASAANTTAIRFIETDDVEESNNKCEGWTYRRINQSDNTNLKVANSPYEVKSTTSTNTTLYAGDFFIKCSRPSSDANLILPDAAVLIHKEFLIKNASTYNVLSSATNIEQKDMTVSNVIVTGKGVARIRSDGTNWLVL